MWGSTFTDLAAQLQESATEAASNLSTTPTSFFNLDAMQNPEDANGKKTAEKIRVPEEPKPSPTTLNFSVDMLSTPQPAVKRPTGMLVVPKVAKSFTPTKPPPSSTPSASKAHVTPRADLNDRMTSNGAPQSAHIGWGAKLSMPSAPSPDPPHPPRETPPPTPIPASETKNFVNGHSAVPVPPRPDAEQEEMVQEDGGWDEDINGLDSEGEEEDAVEITKEEKGKDEETHRAIDMGSETVADGADSLPAPVEATPPLSSSETEIRDVREDIPEEKNQSSEEVEVPEEATSSIQKEADETAVVTKDAEARVAEEECGEAHPTALYDETMETTEEKGTIEASTNDEDDELSSRSDEVQESHVVADEQLPEDDPSDAAEESSVPNPPSVFLADHDASSNGEKLIDFNAEPDDSLRQEPSGDVDSSESSEAPTSAILEEQIAETDLRPPADIESPESHALLETNEPEKNPIDSTESSESQAAPAPVNSQPPIVHTAPAPENAQPPTENKQSVPDSVLEKFSDQMKRMEEGFQYERLEMEQAHSREIQETLDSLNHDACEKERHDLEEAMNAKIYEKELQIHELVRINEGHKLKLDVLKREVRGTQELLEAKEADVGQASEEHLKVVGTLKNQLEEATQQVAAGQQEAKKLQAALDASKNDLNASRQEHSDLKARVKGVATELKDRRVECRDLKARVDELSDVKNKLQQTIESLEGKLFSDGRTRNEKQSEIEELRAKLIDFESKLEQQEKDRTELEAKNNKVLTDYKKKAQNALALANSRTAAAVQAREEAEMEARAARSTADTAMERASKAEASNSEARVKADELVAKMQIEREDAVRKFEEAQASLKAVEEQLAALEGQLRDSTAARDKLAKELESAVQSLQNEKSNVSSLGLKIEALTRHENELQDEISQLRERLRRAEANQLDGESKASEKQASPRAASGPGQESDRETIVALQLELQEANDAIRGLKDALRNAVEMSESKNAATGTDNVQGSSQTAQIDTNGGNGSTPLFYAMEKQAELRLATGEINRLANLLSDVEGEKSAADDAREEMRKRMEEAESRLARFEKLQPTRNDGLVEESHVNGDAQPSPTNSGAVNIEYLKNIMLSFLNAKSVTERKALVPVIGAVLCLTPDELTAAIKNVEQTATLGGVSNSLFESFTGRI